MPTLSIKRLTKTYQRKKSFFAEASSSVDALANIHMELQQGKIYGIVGESGSGKSTLARLLVGLERPDYGSMRLEGEEMHHPKKGKKKRDRGAYQMVFQNPYTSLNPRMRIQDILWEGPRNLGRDEKGTQRKIETFFGKSNLPLELLGKYPHQLSGGERQRVAVIRALLMEPKLLILDEPTSSLDLSVRKQVLELIENLVTGQPMFVLLISHDLSVVKRLADYIFVMRRGGVV